jgi:hypothetical protein
VLEQELKRKTQDGVVKSSTDLNRIMKESEERRSPIIEASYYQKGILDRENTKYGKN